MSSAYQNDVDIWVLDHIMIGVPSHEKAQEQYARLGFTVRAVRPMSPMGGAEAGGVGGSGAIVFEGDPDIPANYLELAYLDEPYAAPPMKKVLGGVTGGAMLVHCTKDAEKLIAAWRERGLKFHPLLDLPVKSVIPGQPDPHYKILIPDGTESGVFVNGCEYVGAMKEFKVPSITTHPNTATRWTDAHVVADPDDYDAIVDFFAHIYDTKPNQSDGAAQFTAGPTTLNIWRKDGFQEKMGGVEASADGKSPFIAATTIEVKDVSAVKGHCEKNGVNHVAEDRRVIVDSSEACGMVIEFIQKS